MKRIKRTPDFELALQIKNDHFIAPPRVSQRNWLVNRALGELASDLDRLDALARTLVAGSPAVGLEDRTQAPLAEQEIMEDWQVPIMRAMAEIATASRGDVLEVGFGRGVSADLIQAAGVRSHTIVECNDSIVKTYEAWRTRYPDSDIRLVHARWQDAIDRMGAYDGVFFHTYPLNEEEIVEYVHRSVTFADHFFPTAAAVLREGGVFTYLTNEIDSLSREHQRRLLEHFRSVTLQVVRDLDLPDTVQDAWWADSMVVVRAER